jgi:general stress protein 26
MSIFDQDAQRVWKLMKKIGQCMLVTNRGGRLRARPMRALPDEKEGLIHFLTAVEGQKDDEIARTPSVCLTFTDGERYLSVSGSAVVSQDKERIRALWSTQAQAWWDSPEDPSIRVLTITPIVAEYWENPGKLVTAVDLAVAAVSGVRPPANPAHKVEMR